MSKERHAHEDALSETELNELLDGAGTLTPPQNLEAGETISPGDAVGIDGGQLRAANSGDTSPNVIGVAGYGGGSDGGNDYSSGEDVPVYLID